MWCDPGGDSGVHVRRIPRVSAKGQIIHMHIRAVPTVDKLFPTCLPSHFTCVLSRQPAGTGNRQRLGKGDSEAERKR